MVFVHLLNRLQRQLQQLARIDLLVCLTAVVAVAALVLRVLLAEIVEQQFTPTDRTLRITLRLEKQLVADADLFRRLVFLETSQTLDVVRAVETDTLSFAAVTTCTACLLIVSFQTLRDVIVDHKTNVRLVDTHTERDRRYDHLTLLHQECVLVRTTRRSIHTGVIRTSRDTIHFQYLCQVLHLLTRQTIDDTALAFHPADIAHKVFIYLFRLRPYFVIQVRTVKTALENGCIWHTKVLLDIFLHFRRSRSRQRYNRRLTDTLNHTADLTVLWTEIMTPFRDTMRLIYGVERDLHTPQKVHVLRFLQTLRRQVQELRLACQHIFLHRIDLSARQTRVDEMRHTFLFRVVTHRIHLVLHQRDQRRDNNRHTLHDQRRQLETETLSASGRHQHKRVLAFHHIANDRLLISLERVKPEIGLQRLH